MMKKILAIWLDYDGCFSDANIKGVRIKKCNTKGESRDGLDKTQPITFQGPIVTHIINAISELEPDEVQIGSFSNRQSLRIDNTNSDMKGTLSSFDVYEAFTQHVSALFPELNVKLNKFLLTDTYQEKYRTGQHWDAALEALAMNQNTSLTSEQLDGLSPAVNIKLIAHQFKEDLFYCKAHEVCADPNSYVQALIYDDLEPALESIYTLYEKHPNLLPHNFAANLFAFTSMTEIDARSGLSREETYRKQSVLQNESSAIFNARKTDVLPGADTNRPEHFPYRSFERETYYSKKNLAYDYLRNNKCSYVDRRALKICHHYHPMFTLIGTGRHNAKGHLLNRELNKHFLKSLGAGLCELWMNCVGTQSGESNGVWSGQETLNDKIVLVAKELLPRSRWSNSMSNKTTHYRIVRVHWPKLHDACFSETAASVARKNIIVPPINLNVFPRTSRHDLGHESEC